ncbi:MAG TPA: hypothetical protein VGI60_05015 [Chthoniobacterales bacterium]
MTNESALPIYNITQQWHIECGRGGIGPDALQKPQFTVLRALEMDTESTGAFARLESYESRTVYPLEKSGYDEVTVDHIKLIAEIKYQSFLFHWHREKLFCFEGSFGTDGSIHWYHTTMDALKGRGE